MRNASGSTARKPLALRRWIRLGFLLWAVASTAWLANSIRTRGVDEDLLRDSPAVSVSDDATTLAFTPSLSDHDTALVFISGSGVAAAAYAPLLRPVAEAGYPVFVIKLPYRFAPLESNKREILDRTRRVMAAHPEVLYWVLAGHSLGGKMAARMAHSDPRALSALVLIGTTHPKSDDLSWLQIPVTKVYGTNDGVAPPERVIAGRGLLPSSTTWVEIVGANHSQFGRYGHQLMDGDAEISREEQEAITRSAIFEAMSGASH